MQQGEIVIYRTEELPDFQMEVLIEYETIWLTQAQIVELFDTSKANVSEHIKHIFHSKELNPSSTVRKIRTVQLEGRRKVSRILHFLRWTDL